MFARACGWVRRCAGVHARANRHTHTHKHINTRKHKHTVVQWRIMGARQRSSDRTQERDHTHSPPRSRATAAQRNSSAGEERRSGLASATRESTALGKRKAVGHGNHMMAVDGNQDVLDTNSAALERRAARHDLGHAQALRACGQADTWGRGGQEKCARTGQAGSPCRRRERERIWGELSQPCCAPRHLVAWQPASHGAPRVARDALGQEEHARALLQRAEPRGRPRPRHHRANVPASVPARSSPPPSRGQAGRPLPPFLDAH